MWYLQKLIKGEKISTELNDPKLHLCGSFHQYCFFCCCGYCLVWFVRGLPPVCALICIPLYYFSDPPSWVSVCLILVSTFKIISNLLLSWKVNNWVVDLEAKMYIRSACRPEISPVQSTWNWSVWNLESLIWLPEVLFVNVLLLSGILENEVFRDLNSA